MELQLIMVVAKLLDICAFSVDGTPNLVIVEFGDRIEGKKNAQASYWHLYNYSRLDTEWHSRSTFTQTIPSCGVIKASSYADKFTAVLQSNTEHALTVITAAPDSSNTYRTLASIEVDLPDDSWMNIKIPEGGSWSTPFLYMERCMFNPHILTIDAHNVMVVANPVDASARLFMVGKDVQEIGKIDRCIEPCVVNVKDKKVVIGRRCPKEWAVFYNQPNTRMAPELLPLVAYQLDKNYSVTDTIQLSKGWDTGSSFAFDVCSTDDNAIVLATVTGTLKRPHLQVLVSLDGGTRWEEKQIITLAEVPFRTRITATNKKIMVACTFKKHDGFHVMAAEFDR